MREFSQPDGAVSYNALLPVAVVAMKARGILEDWLDFFAGIEQDQ